MKFSMLPNYSFCSSKYTFELSIYYVFEGGVIIWQYQRLL